MSSRVVKKEVMILKIVCLFDFYSKLIAFIRSQVVSVDLSCSLSDIISNSNTLFH